MRFEVLDFSQVLAALSFAGRMADQDEAAGQAARDAALAERARLRRWFPFGDVLALFYPPLDLIKHWRGRRFGAGDGECLKRHSDFPSCAEPLPHCPTLKSAGACAGGKKPAMTLA